MSRRPFLLVCLAGSLLTTSSRAERAERAESQGRRLQIPVAGQEKVSPFPGYLPAKADKASPCPLVVLFHGVGDTAGHFIRYFEPAADAGGFALLAPETSIKNGDRGPGYGSMWGQGEDVKESVKAGIERMVADHPEVDRDRIVWLGFSQGNQVCCQWGPALPGLCRGVVLCAPPSVRLRPAGKGAPVPPVAIFLGTRDRLYEKKFLDPLRLELSRSPSKNLFNLVEGLGHELPADDYLVSGVRWVLGEPQTSAEKRLSLEPPDPAADALRRKEDTGPLTGEAFRQKARGILQDHRDAADALELFLDTPGDPREFRRFLAVSQEASRAVPSRALATVVAMLVTHPVGRIREIASLALKPHECDFPVSEEVKAAIVLELRPRLDDRDPKIRSSVCYALGRSSDPALAEEFALLLKDGDPDVRSSAIQALGVIASVTKTTGRVDWWGSASPVRDMLQWWEQYRNQK